MQARKRPENKHKKYVSVIVCYQRYEPNAKAKIVKIQFENGDVLHVDKTHRGYPAAAQKAGGQGMLYKILASQRPENENVYQGQPREYKLFHDGEDWFIEMDYPDDEC